MDLIEKPISNNIYKKYLNKLTYDIDYIYRELLGISEYEENEYDIFGSFIYDGCYENILYENHVNDDSDLFKYNNLFELFKDKYNLDISVRIINLIGYGCTNEDELYIASLDSLINMEEYKIFKKWCKAYNFEIYDGDSIILGDYDEIDVSFVFLWKDNKIFDYCVIDNMYDSFNALNDLIYFKKYMFKKNPKLFMFENNKGSMLIDKLKKVISKTKEIVY